MLNVSTRFLPQRLVLDAGDDVGFGDEVVEEAVPPLDGHACGCEHVAYLVDAVVGQRGEVVVVPDMDADDIAVGQVVVVADDGLEKFGVFAQPAGHVGDGADVGRCGHHAAWLCGWIAGTQFHGSNSVSRFIL